MKTCKKVRRQKLEFRFTLPVFNIPPFIIPYFIPCYIGYFVQLIQYLKIWKIYTELKGRDHLGDLGVDRWIILKCILKI
jgi:hypothetical protein